MELHCQVLDVTLPCSYVRCHHTEVGEGARDRPVHFTATSCKAIIILKSSLKKKKLHWRLQLLLVTLCFSPEAPGEAQRPGHIGTGLGPCLPFGAPGPCSHRVGSTWGEFKGVQALDCLDHQDHLWAGPAGLISKQAEANSRMYIWGPGGTG